MENNSETTPLINNHQRGFNYEVIFVGFLLFIFIIGMTAGTYLLLTEDEEWRLPGAFSLIGRDVWGAHVPLYEIPKLALPASGVFFLQTNGTGCTADCAKVMLDLQSEHMRLGYADILYNFAIGGDGHVYEGRGWTYAADSDGGLATVAFLGNFNNLPPSVRQINGAKLFLDAAMVQNNLISCFNVLVQLQHNRQLFDAVNLIYNEIVHCDDEFN